jgi:hypothetical protein
MCSSIACSKIFEVSLIEPSTFRETRASTLIVISDGLTNELAAIDLVRGTRFASPDREEAGRLRLWIPLL